MEKFYPPFQITQIIEYKDRTTVKVVFWKISRAKFEDNLILKGRGGDEPERIIANFGAKLDSIETFTLPKMRADEARSNIYSQIEQTDRSKKVIV